MNSNNIKDPALPKVIDESDMVLVKKNLRYNLKLYNLYKDEKENHYWVKKYNKYEIVKCRNIDNIYNELTIMSTFDSPFILKLYGFSQNKYDINIYYDFWEGDELFNILKSKNKFDVETTSYLSSAIILFFEHLHHKLIIYRDLKPENIFINKDGSIKVNNYFLIKKLESRTYTICGTPEYMSPEMLRMKGYGKSQDWWSLGVFIYELLVGFPPFIDDDPMVMYDNILNSKIEFPYFVRRIAKNLLKGLLNPDLTKRLGNLKDGVLDIKNHQFFKDIDFEKILENKSNLTPTPVDKVSELFDLEENKNTISEKQNKIFENWSN